LIYEKALQIRAVNAKEVTAIATMGTDTERIYLSMELLHDTWASVLDVAIATWLLQRQIGLACLAPIVVTGCKSWALCASMLAAC
jgi:ATP-binding cassette subfamily C (CFTR/MRP) protein 1